MMYNRILGQVFTLLLAFGYLFWIIKLIEAQPPSSKINLQASDYYKIPALSGLESSQEGKWVV